MAHSAVETQAHRDQLGPAPGDLQLWDGVQRLLRPLASLKLTVVLFAMAIFIVLAGTLAQVDKDIWEVINGYFRIDFSSPGSALHTSFAWIPLKIFFPPSFFPSKPQVPGGFYFPSGWLIGIAMAINLIAAHLVRFRIQARGGRLLGGVALIAAGILVTAMVIASGSNKQGFQEATWIKWSTLWWLCMLGLLVAWLAMLYGWSRMLQSSETGLRVLIPTGAAVGLLGVLLGWLLYRGDSAMLGDSSMRILWQLIKGLLAGGVLLGGCFMVFKKRAGIVLLHGGILLMMAGEVLVGTAAVEGQMQIFEGQTVNFVQDIRSAELAFVTPAGPDEDDVVVVPASILRRGGKIHHKLLPFDVELVKDGYYKNSELRLVQPGDENRATVGIGLQQIAEKARPSSGTDMSSRADYASAYIKLTKKGKSLGTYLVSQWLGPEMVVETFENTPPNDWERQAQPPSMSLLAYRVKRDGEQADVTVTLLPGSAGGLEANLARWRRQAGLEPMPGKDAESREIALDGGSAVYVDLAAPASAGQGRSRILGMIADRDGQTWFFKMMGPYDLVESQKGAFEAWARSVRFPAACAVSLRFKRTYKPYSVQLLDVRKDDYIGTDTPRNYSSDIRLADATRHVDRNIHIWMNNPLRYAGETFYQSGYNRDQAGREITTLQVVTNTGWMIPYVACMLVVTGLLFHFGIALVRFLNRRASGAALEVATPSAQDLRNARRALAIKSRKPRDFSPRPEPTVDLGNSDLPDPASWLVPVVVVALFAAFVISRARPPHAPADSMQIYEFGKLPVAYEGRVKPFDTLARTMLRVLSNKETFRDSNGDRQPAIRWLLDAISGAQGAEEHRVFRIDNPEVLDTLGLKPRKGYCYSVKDISGKYDEFNKQRDLAASVPTENLSVYQRKVLDLARRIQTYALLRDSFLPPSIGSLITKEEFEKDPSAARKKIAHKLLVEGPRRFEGMNPPLAVPVKSTGKDGKERQWKPYASAWGEAFVRTQMLGEELDPATASLTAILAAYARGDVSKFNNEVKAYAKALQKDPPEGFHWSRSAFEAYFNHLSGFFFSAWFYLAAFVLAALGWLGWSRPLNRAAFWLIVATLGLHTFSLIGRIYISGRPPVTNLYSSAIFISWGCVVLGLVFEMVYRVGIGNVLAGVGGFATLYIAHLLTTAVPSFRGDTFTVMQAVLDTQFWLATHVVCITLGYATTYVAGLLGILYVVLGVATPRLTPKLERDLLRMIYGTVCFALFFSFFGTVLGGLWADDSWGRFWGWDPKENGALIIVLWNALVLHARWNGMARQRGLALLAVGGNIAVSWSWFGVNELGVGLHSYGFTEGVVMTLGLFVLSQLAVIAAGALPKELWWSFRRRGVEEATA